MKLIWGICLNVGYLFERWKNKLYHGFSSSQCGEMQPRFYIHLILSCRESGFATLWAIVCSSWVQINCFTSKRSRLLPEGDWNRRYIEEANCMMSRILIYRLFFIVHAPYRN